MPAIGENPNRINAEPWPNNVLVFQPFETGQMALPDRANCYAVHAFLKFYNLSYEIESRANAEFMSPSGTVPFIKCDNLLVSDLEPIVGFVKSRGIQLYELEEGSGDLVAYMDMVKRFLSNVELNLAWANDSFYNKFTKQDYGSVYPWPLNMILPKKKRWEVVKKLKAQQLYKEDFDEICEVFKTCIQALSDRLGTSHYFFGAMPTELDALVFGHIHAFYETTTMETNILTQILEQFSNIHSYYLNIKKVLNRSK